MARASRYSTRMTPSQGVECRIEDGAFVCDFNGPAERVANESAGRACVVDPVTRRWDCKPLPNLHGKTVQIHKTEQDQSNGQRWAYVGRDKVPVPVTAAVSRRTPMASLGNALSTFTRALVSPLGAVVGQRRPSSSMLMQRMRGSNPDQIHPTGPWGLTIIDPFKKDKIYPTGPWGITIVDPFSKDKMRRYSSLTARKLRNCACLAPPASQSVSGSGTFTYGDARIAGRRRNQSMVTSFTAPTSVCCYDAATGRLVCPTSSKLNGAKVALEGVDNPDSATPRARVTMPDGRVRALPICPSNGMEPGDGVPMDCCYDPMTKTLLCPSSDTLNGQAVSLDSYIDLNDNRKGAIVRTQGGEALTVPVCRPPSDVPPPTSCCVDESTMRIVCDDPSHPWNGVDVSIVASCYTDESGNRVCFVDISGDTNTILPVCNVPGLTSTPPTEPPPTVSDCCFRRSTMTIECTDTSSPLHGIVVPEAAVSFGADYADISIGGDVMNRLPLCPEPPGFKTPPGEKQPPVSNCCFRRSTMTIECTDTSNPLHGIVVPAAAVSFGSDYADISIGGDVMNRLPLCPEPPPPGGDCGPGGYKDQFGNCVYTPPPPGGGGDCGPGAYMDPFGNCVYTPPPPPDHPPGEPCCDSCANGNACESTCPGLPTIYGVV